jgi:hypothetical protein
MFEFKSYSAGYQAHGTKNRFSDRGLFKNESCMPLVVGSVVYACRRLSKSVYLKRMASSQNFFVWFRGGLNLPAGSDTPQNKILRDIRLLRTMAKLCTFYSRHLFCEVWYPAEQHPAGSDNPLNKVLRGIRPRGTKSCGVSNPAEQHLNTNISPNSKQNSKIF